MRMANPEIDEIQPRDPWLVKKGQLLLTELWIGEHEEDPFLNPFLGGVRDVGRLFVLSGTRYLLNPDTRLFCPRVMDVANDYVYHVQRGFPDGNTLQPTPTDSM